MELTRSARGNMATASSSQSMQTARLDHTLECAAVQSWDQLMPSSTSGLIQIEYQTGSDGSLDFFKIWASSIRGHWDLVCEFWMRSLWSHPTGLRFGPRYHSAEFDRTLELLMGHEGEFLKLPHQQGLIQISPPTPEERTAAGRWMGVAFNHDHPVPMQPQIA